MRPPPEPIEWETETVWDGGNSALMFGPLILLIIIIAAAVVFHA